MSESTRTVDRALALLGVVCERGTATLTDAARGAELAPSTALRLLRSLESTRFLRRADEGAYVPGPRMIELSALALGSLGFVEPSRGPMRELARRTGESTYLSVVGEGDTAVYVAVEEGTHLVRHHAWVGRSIPLAGSAAGRVLAGEVATSILVAEGVEPDVTALAAPIRRGGRVVAALSLLVPSFRADDATVASYTTALHDAAAAINARLGESPATEVAG